MASHVYPLAKESFLQGGINLSSVAIKCVLLTSAYTYSAAHQYRSSLAGAITGGTSGNLASKTFTAGVFDAADITLTSVSSGSTVAAVVGYVDTGAAATDNLIFYVDGLSQLTNGGDITLTWDSGASKIFAL